MTNAEGANRKNAPRPGCWRWSFVRGRRRWRSWPPFWQGAAFAGGACGGVVVAVFMCWLVFGGQRAHDLAEALGGVGALVATAFVALTLWLQSRELELQRQELRATREEMKQQGRQLERQSDLMESELAMDHPRLVADFAARSDVGSGPSYSVRIQNLGGRPITQVLVRAYRGTGEDGRVAPATPRDALAPNAFVPMLSVQAPDRRAALAATLEKADRIVVKFTDAMNVRRNWTIQLSGFASTQSMHFSDSLGEPEQA